MVQGVGFRPFVFRLARANTLAGWVLNGEEGVEIHLEGAEPSLDAFVRELKRRPRPPPASPSIDVTPRSPRVQEFTIRDSQRREHPTRSNLARPCRMRRVPRRAIRSREPRYRLSLHQLHKLRPALLRRLSLPYDRANTTMQGWPLDDYCAMQYHDPGDRRFHAQPVACPHCGPHYYLQVGNETVAATTRAFSRPSSCLRDGQIVAVKGIGGYHLACDARNRPAVNALRERKFRKEKPFARDGPRSRRSATLVELSAEAEALLTSAARPIVLAPAKAQLPTLLPDNDELGVMLPYTPLHHLLFAAGAPDVLVMTSANRSSEPIAYRRRRSAANGSRELPTRS